MTKDKSIKLAVDLTEKLFTQNEQYIKNLEKEIDDLRRQQRQQQWVGLTRMELIKCGVFPFGMSYKLCQIIEAKLREKNT